MNGGLDTGNRFLSRITVRLARFWWQPTSAEPLGLLRIGVASIALVQLAVLAPHLLNLFGNFGLVQWIILEEADDTWIPSIGKLAVVLAEFGVSSTSAGLGVFMVYGLSLLALLAGWHTRIAAIVAWGSHTLMVNSGYVSLYGVDTMLHLCLFYFVFMPVGATYALDTRRGTTPRHSIAATIALRTFQLHICVIYLDAAMAKLSGEGWRTGEALWRATMQPQFAVFDFSFLASVPVMTMLAAWSIVALQFIYPLLVWHRRLRRPMLVAIIGLHLGIAVFMGLWLFSIMMIAMNYAAFGWSESEDAPPVTSVA